MKMAIAALGIVAPLVAGCATGPLLPYSVAGSKSDAVVVMAVEKHVFDNRTVEWGTAKVEAQGKCIAWGYADAQPFSGNNVNCLQRNQYGTCLVAQFKRTYQCTGKT